MNRVSVLPWPASESSRPQRHRRPSPRRRLSSRRSWSRAVRNAMMRLLFACTCSKVRRSRVGDLGQGILGREKENKTYRCEALHSHVLFPPSGCLFNLGGHDVHHVYFGVLKRHLSEPLPGLGELGVGLEVLQVLADLLVLPTRQCHGNNIFDGVSKHRRARTLVRDDGPFVARYLGVPGVVPLPRFAGRGRGRGRR